MDLFSEIYGFVAMSAEVSVVRGGTLDFIRADFLLSGKKRSLFILPAKISEISIPEAEKSLAARQEAYSCLKRDFGPGSEIITVAEDRWRSLGPLFRSRLMAHLGVFRSVFARNCEVRRIEKPLANAFMSENHNYGAAVCRHCYGLFEKKSGDLVAAATFSNARRWIKSGQEVRSFEWVRYASASGVRVAGGMGKVLNRFILDILPDDVMSYADLEWSDGAVYRRLGFVEDGFRPPVLFSVDPQTWQRRPVKDGEGRDNCSGLYYMNSGSLKYRLPMRLHR